MPSTRTSASSSKPLTRRGSKPNCTPPAGTCRTRRWPPSPSDLPPATFTGKCGLSNSQIRNSNHERTRDHRKHLLLPHRTPHLHPPHHHQGRDLLPPCVPHHRC